MLMSENSSLIYDKSDVLWVNPYISDQQQQQQKQKQQQNQQIPIWVNFPNESWGR